MSQDREFADTVAIIGMSCRFAPNLNSPDKFWTFLAEGGSSVSEMPEKRWAPYVSSSPQATAIMRQTTRLGSFMEDIEGFDADFFGISPREADFLDPQQRIMLELAWEALVNAGVPPLSLRGSDAGVYVAANSNDYGRRLLEDIPLTGAYAVNGTTYYGIANRVSYFLDLRGPSMAVDTACAGSLTAMHLACQALRANETPMAVVGGVNIMSTPALFVALDAAGATAPDGRSKAFDKHADGYGRGEGAGVVVLKRAADARRDGDPILALVLGSGVFQDGRSDGMMAPNSSAQENMLRQTYDRTGISPDTVGYVEAHGTGTPVGDREEVRALARVFGQGRPPGDTCLIGSVKPNIGHTEGGSGIAGVIKTVLALRHEQLPPSLHTEPNPDLDWNHSGLSLVGALSPWPAHGQPRRAGVSSYGVGGTIAHLILQEAPQPPAPRREAVTAPHTTTAGRPTVFPVSAMSEAGLRATAGTVADWLEDNPDVSLASVGHTLARRRSHLSQRAAVIASTADELTAGLRAVADGRRTPSAATGRALSGKAADVVWVFSGHGAQWSGMGRQLLRQEPSFAQVIDALEDVYRAEMGWTPREAIVQGGPWTASQAQAMTYAMQVGLMAVWRRHGVAPRAVIGHSVGEIAAAVAAGSLDLIEAARFACRRAVALRRIEGLGAMVLARLSFQEAQKRLAGRRDVVAAIAASTGSAVISGDREAVQHIAAQWQQEGIELWHVDTDIAFHSPHIDAAIQDVTAAAAEMTPRPPLVDLYTTTLADPRSTAPRDSSYWADNLRRPVRFADAVQAAHDDGYRVFAEVSSHPVVTHSITETLDHLGAEDAVVVPTLRRNADEVGTFLASLAGIHCHGAAVEWSREHAGGELVPLPAAAWQHRPYWIFPPVSGGAELGSGHDPDSHTLLGGRMSISGAPARKVWQTFLDMSCRPYPQSHEVVGVEITPAAAIVSTFVAAAKRDGEIPALSDIVLRTPLAVTPPRVVQVVLAENTIRLASRIASDEAPSDDEEDEWITHTTAAIDWTAAAPTGTVDVAGIRARCDDEWDWSRVDDLFRGKGVGGYAFPWDLDELRRNDDEQLSILTLVPPPATRSGSWAHVIDGALTISAVLVTPEDAHRLWMSSQMGSVVFRGEPPARITVHTRRSANSPRDTVDVLVAGDDGQVVCAVTGLRFAPLQDQRRAQATPRDLVHEVVWRPVRPDAADGTPVRSVIIVGAEQHGRLGELLGDAGIRYVHVDSHEDLAAVPLSGHDAVIVTPARMTAGESPEQAAERCAWELVSTAQQVSAAAAAAYNTVDGAPAMPKVWCLTRGVREARDESALAHAPLWGIGRIIAGERPDIWGGVIDLGEPELNAPAARRLLLLLRHAGGEEDIFSLTDTGTAVARLTATERPAEGPALKCRATGTYLITGGLGGIGLTVAHWLVDRGVRRLLLLSRRGLPPRTEWDQVTDPVVQRQIQGVLELEALGVTVRVLAVDISDADQVAAALDPSAHGLPPVRGIIHAAGVVEDAMLDNVDRQSLRNVLGPKTSGAMVLHRLFPPGTLDFLVLFSSCGQFARLTGQLSYAAGNSFLDALAAHRHGTGHTETASLAWTSWQGVGMAAGPGTTMLEANSRGLDEISVAEAFRAWSFADRFRVPYQAILRVLPLPAHTPRLPMFRELTATDVTPEDTGGQGFLIDATGLSDQELRELVTDDVRQQVAAELNLADEEVEIRRPLVELGVDSVLTVALRVRLNRRFGLDLPPTILWSQPTVSALGGYIAESVRARAGAAEETAFDQDEPIAA